MQSSKPEDRRQGVVAGLAAQSMAPITALFGVSLVSNLLMLTGPLFMLQVYDRVLASRSVPTLLALVALVATLYGFYALIEWLRSRMAIRFAGMINETVAEDMFRASVRMRLLPNLETADPVRDLDTLRQFASGPGPISLFDLPWIPIYLGVIFLFHFWLGALATAGLIVVTVLLAINEVTSRRPTKDMTSASGARQLLGEDAKANAESILSMSMLDAVSDRWKGLASALTGRQQKAADWAAFFTATTKSFRLLLQSMVLAVGAFLVLQNEITAGLMIVASIVTSRALAPVEQVVAHWRGFVAARQSMTRIDETLKRFAHSPERTELPLPEKTLSVSQMASGPDPRKPPLVRGISWELEAGDCLGILGPSGSGKTSLMRAVIGVWPVLQGEIRLDGSELSHYDPARLGSAIGYLPQQVELIAGTVAENIARFTPEATSHAIIKAAQAAHAHELITALPEGYDTPIGYRGAVLSAGQRQRIGLARALYGDPFLVALDEPNSNLDAEGEAALTAALMGVRQRGGIAIVIAHRPSAIEAANKILFVQGGQQQAFGPKDEILNKIIQKPQRPARPEVQAHG
jgi:ATP-binding cassette subfamily C protein PrsD